MGGSYLHWYLSFRPESLIRIHNYTKIVTPYAWNMWWHINMFAYCLKPFLCVYNCTKEGTGHVTIDYVRCFLWHLEDKWTKKSGQVIREINRDPCERDTIDATAGKILTLWSYNRLFCVLSWVVLCWSTGKTGWQFL